MPDWLEIETHGGEPIAYQGNTITPFVQTWIVRLPFIKGGLIWNRPVSILAVDRDGKEEIMPVPDVTRQVQIGLLAAVLVSGLFFRLLQRKN